MDTLQAVPWASRELLTCALCVIRRFAGRCNKARFIPSNDKHNIKTASKALLRLITEQSYIVLADYSHTNSTGGDSKKK